MKRIGEAKLSRKTTLHEFRRFFATELLDKQKDLKTVADLVGHPSAETTAVYDRRDKGALKSAQAAIHWPEVLSDDAGSCPE